MESGTKTLNHGDLIAVSIEMVSKGGSDSIQVGSYNMGISARSGSSMYFPYITTDSGSGPGRAGSVAIGCAIEFDDGSLGWIEPGILAPFTSITTNFSSTSSPDEYAAVFELPFKCRISGGYYHIGSIGATDPFEIILYSDPEGTPTPIATISVDPDAVGSSSGTPAPFYFSFSSSITITPNTRYAIAIRPTNFTIGINTHSFGSGNDKYKKAFPFGGNVFLMGRTDQTGAFSTIQTYYLPLFGLMIDQLDDGAGGGEGGFFIQ